MLPNTIHLSIWPFENKTVRARFFLCILLSLSIVRFFFFFLLFLLFFLSKQNFLICLTLIVSKGMGKQAVNGKNTKEEDEDRGPNTRKKEQPLVTSGEGCTQ